MLESNAMKLQNFLFAIFYDTDFKDIDHSHSMFHAKWNIT